MSNTSIYNLEVTIGSKTINPVLSLADNGRWSINDDGLKAMIGESQFREWLTDVWSSIRDGRNYTYDRDLVA